VAFIRNCVFTAPKDKLEDKSKADCVYQIPSKTNNISVKLDKHLTETK